MADASEKSKKTKNGWKKKVLKTFVTEDNEEEQDEIQAAFRNESLSSIQDDFRWSMTASEEIKGNQNNRMASCPTGEMYLSDSTNEYTDASDDDLDIENDGNEKTKKKTKKKKAKKKKEKEPGSISTKKSAGTGISSKRSKSPTRTKAASKKDKKKNDEKKKKKKKRSTDTDSCSDDSMLESSKVETGASEDLIDGSISSTEGADKFEGFLPGKKSKPGNGKKLDACMSGRGGLLAMSSLVQEFSSIVSSRQDTDRNAADQAFLEAYHQSLRAGEGEEVFKRVSEQSKGMMENLLSELQKYELDLAEERSEAAKERAALQMKQQTLEQMLQTQTNKNSMLEFKVKDLKERLEQATFENGDGALLQKIKMLEAENDILRRKIERHRQSMAVMAVGPTHEANSDRRGSMKMLQELPPKEKGELLMLRKAFDDQAKELAKKTELLNSSKDRIRVQELEETVSSFSQQIRMLMDEIERLKKSDTSGRPKADRKTSWWGGTIEEDDAEADLMDVADTSKKKVFGSVSDTEYLDDSDTSAEDDVPVPQLQEATSANSWWGL